MREGFFDSIEKNSPNGGLPFAILDNLSTSEKVLTGAAVVAGAVAVAAVGRGRLGSALGRAGESVGAHGKTEALPTSLPHTQGLVFGDHGFLKPGVYKMDFPSFRAAFSGTPERRKLLDEFADVVAKMRLAGVREVHVGGSFVTRKAIPGDIDFAWNKYERPYNHAVLKQFDNGTLVRHDSLRGRGLQNLSDPPGNGTYRDILHFLGHGPLKDGPKIDFWAQNVRVRELFAAAKTPIVPKGIVQIDLTRPFTQIGL